MHLVPGLSAHIQPSGTDSLSRPRERLSGRARGKPSAQQQAASKDRQIMVYLASLLGGATLAAAWLVPETRLSALLGWVAALLVVYAVRIGPAFLPLYCAGLVGHVLGFHWVYDTVRAFGGVGPAAGGLIFAVFVALGALEFLVFAVIDHHLHPVFDGLALRSATAAVVAELVTVRLFPWHFGHTQIAFTPFVQIAGLGGAMAVSFLMFWVAEAAIRVIVFRERRIALSVPLVAFVLAIAYGAAMMGVFSEAQGISQDVVLVQGNATLAEKRDLESARANLARIYELSRAAAPPGSLVVWPEGSVPAYIPAGVGSLGNPPCLPNLGGGSAMLLGAYSFLPSQERFNAAFAVYPDGVVPMPYFKQILIPFGEAIPFSGYFPWLKRLNPKAGVFSAGTETRVFPYPMRQPDGTPYTMNVSPLICYEDTVPALAREAAKNGTQLLVNVTSDSWFGRSLAPHQHHLIAAFRAIENRRFLVRATNTGYSGVVDPLGRTIARIEPFCEGTATARVRLLDYRSAYTEWVGERPWWGLLMISLGLVLARHRRQFSGSPLAIPVDWGILKLCRSGVEQ
jgi:apolipoprotein N-acyltransferase